MKVTVTGKQLNIGEELRDHMQHRLADAVSKYFDHALDASVVLSREAYRLRADISVHVGRGILVQGHGDGDNPYSAFDAASERIAKQLRRYKRRLRDHHRKSRTVETEDRLVALQYVLAAEEEAETGAGENESDQPVVIAETTTEIDTLTVGEAVMRMELADQGALMFRNSAHGGLNVVYRRPDGNLGWIDPRDATGWRNNV